LSCFSSFPRLKALCDNQAGGAKDERSRVARTNYSESKDNGRQALVQGTRLTVEYVLNLLAHGATTEEILTEYQGLKPEDIQACFLFATKSLGNTDFMPLTIETA
jgi:uncharacterized protein (DUF433 family)